MPVRIRLRRMGKKKQPFYRIIAVDSHGKRDGKYLDKIGHYNPLPDPAEVVVDEEKALLWLNRGAEPSNTVKDIFRRRGLFLRWHLMKQGFDEDRITEELKKWEVLQIEKDRRKEAKAIQKEREKEQAKEEQEQAEEAKPKETSPVADAEVVAEDVAAPEQESAVQEDSEKQTPEQPSEEEKAED